MDELGDEMSAPSRATLARVWSDLANGGLDRADVHSWVSPWVQGALSDVISDPMVLNAVQYLHGFDLAVVDGVMVHAPSHYDGPFVKPATQIAADLAHWRRECSLYDRNPVEFMENKVAHALEAVAAERRARHDS